MGSKAGLICCLLAIKKASLCYAKTHVFGGASHVHVVMHILAMFYLSITPIKCGLRLQGYCIIEMALSVSPGCRFTHKARQMRGTSTSLPKL